MSTQAPKRHALSASAADRWMNCLYSAYYEKDAPYVESDAATRGTLIHAFAAQAMRDAMSELYPEAEGHFGGALGAVEGEIDAEAEMLVGQYVDDVVNGVTRLQTMHGAMTSYHIEGRLSQWPLKGSVDFYAVFGDKAAALVVDLKTGEWKVTTHENPQLLAYAMMIPAGQYYGMIVQPGGIDNQPTPLQREGKVGTAITAKIRYYAEYPQAPRGLCVIGEWCRWCRLEGSCPRKASLACDAFNAARHRGDTPDNPTDVGELFRVLKVTEGMLEAVKRNIRALYGLGVSVPGTKVVTMNRREWAPDITPESLAEKLQVPLDAVAETAPRLRSVAQVEKSYSLKDIPDAVKSVVIHQVRED